MGKQRWRKWVMAAAIAGMLAGQTGVLTVQAEEMPVADAVVETPEEISAEIPEEISAPAEAPEEETAPEQIEEQGTITEEPTDAVEEVVLSDNYSSFIKALRQIGERDYQASLTAKGIPKEGIRKYRFAFCGKEVLIGAAGHQN